MFCADSGVGSRFVRECSDATEDVARGAQGAVPVLLPGERQLFDNSKRSGAFTEEQATAGVGWRAAFIGSRQRLSSSESAAGVCAGFANRAFEGLPPASVVIRGVLSSSRHFASSVIYCGAYDGNGDDGSGDHGSGDDGSGDDGSGDDGSGDDGSGDDGSGDDGSSDHGSGDDGSGYDGSGENGSGDDGNGIGEDREISDADSGMGDSDAEGEMIAEGDIEAGYDKDIGGEEGSGGEGDGGGEEDGGWEEDGGGEEDGASEEENSSQEEEESSDERPEETVERVVSEYSQLLAEAVSEEGARDATGIDGRDVMTAMSFLLGSDLDEKSFQKCILMEPEVLEEAWSGLSTLITESQDTDCPVQWTDLIDGVCPPLFSNASMCVGFLRRFVEPPNALMHSQRPLSL
jgi:hypothetical protein